MFMKKATFAFIGLLACVLSVSCEDKLLDDEKKNSPENSDSDSFKSVLDSSFTYVDGMLEKETRKYYTQNGLEERTINKTYNSDGSLNTNEESVYTYSDSKGDNYVCISSSNGVELKKEEASYSGKSGTYVTNTKKYVKHGGEWFLKSQVYVNTENYRGYGYNISYMIYNGQRVPVDRVALIDAQEDPVTDKLLYLEKTYYSANYRTDPTDPDGLTLSSLGGGIWRKRIERSNSDGNTLYREDLLSTDSVIWRSTGGTETEYDKNGNLVSERYFSGDGKTEGIRYNKYSDDKFMSSSYCDLGNGEGDSVWSTSKVFHYSDAGVLDSAEFFFDYNMAGRFPIDLTRVMSDIYLGLGKNGVLGTKYVVLFDSNGNPVRETLYQKDENGEMKNTACAYCTMTYDSNGRMTGYMVYVSVNGEWVQIETGNRVYDSQGKELSSHVCYTGIPEGADVLDSDAIPSKYSQYESNGIAEYDSYGNLSYKKKEESYSMTYINFEDGNLNERSCSEKTEEFYSTIKVK